MKQSSKLGAEFIGTFVLVFGGTGAAVLAAKFLGAGGVNTGLGIGFLGVSLAFGLTVLTMAYAVGHISGGHFNPAITIGLATAKRFEWREALPYIVIQVDRRHRCFRHAVGHRHRPEGHDEGQPRRGRFRRQRLRRVTPLVSTTWPPVSSSRSC